MMKVPRIHPRLRTEERMSPEFLRCFNGPDLWANPRLWRSYNNWKKRNEAGLMAQFRDDLLMAQQQVAEDMAAMPNPFINAKKGEPYEISVHIPASVRAYRFKGLGKARLADIGWEKDTRTARIKGRPDQAGDFEFTLYCMPLQWEHGLPVLKRVFKFVVLPDPKDLWQDIPSSQEEEYARPDLDFQNIECPDCRMFAASRRGRSHAHTGKPRDDAFGLSCQGDWRIMIVADGAGSAPFSRRGAQIACEVALEECAKKLAEDIDLDAIFLSDLQEGWQAAARKAAYGILANAAFEANKAIRGEAKKTERDNRAFATTFLLALAKKYPAGWAVMSFQVGDGAMAALGQNSARLLAEPDEGEYGGQTRFITMDEIFEPHELMRRLNVEFMAGFEELILMTDGVSDCRFATLDGLKNPSLWRELTEEINPLLQSADSGPDLLEWLNFWSRGNHDDRTIAILKAGE